MNEDERPCLHCSLTEMISAYWHHFGNKDAESGSPIMDASQTLLSLAEAQASIIGRLAAGAEQQVAVEDAHSALDALLEASRTGHEVKVTFRGSPH